MKKVKYCHIVGEEKLKKNKKLSLIIYSPIKSVSELKNNNKLVLVHRGLQRLTLKKKKEKEVCRD